ncbi:SOS response-associated peptidase family protein [Bacillus thuringiensis]|nr:SOS response-associated peptidase family protein [Bacillus thuringiensis]
MSNKSILSTILLTFNKNERMPVILKKDDEDLWLDREKYDRLQLQSLFTPYDSSEMMVYPVSAKVGSPKMMILPVFKK